MKAQDRKPPKTDLHQKASHHEAHRADRRLSRTKTDYPDHGDFLARANEARKRRGPGAGRRRAATAAILQDACH